jgi:hypothetical protein
VSIGDVVTLLKDIGPITLVFALMVTGMIVPKWVHDDVKKQRDEWKRAAELSDARADAIMDTSRVTNEVMHSLNRELGSASHGSGQGTGRGRNHGQGHGSPGQGGTPP